MNHRRVYVELRTILGNLIPRVHKLDVYIGPTALQNYYSLIYLCDIDVDMDFESVRRISPLPQNVSVFRYWANCLALFREFD